MIALAAITALFWWLKPKPSQIQIGPVTIPVEIAASAEAKMAGLSGRDRLGEQEGMLFIFDQPDQYAFWMKEMKFPLDFIWIDGDQVVDLTENVGVNEMNIMPVFPADKVVEVNAGFVARHGIKVGDRVK